VQRFFDTMKDRNLYIEVTFGMPQASVANAHAVLPLFVALCAAWDVGIMGHIQISVSQAPQARRWA
jgi:hypothetical protein